MLEIFELVWRRLISILSNWEGSRREAFMGQKIKLTDKICNMRQTDMQNKQ